MDSVFAGKWFSDMMLFDEERFDTIVRMQRIIDKTALFACCLVCMVAYMGRPDAGIGANDVIVALLALCAAALDEVLPASWRPCAPIALTLAAFASGAGAWLLPIAVYDSMREFHCATLTRWTVGVPAAALVITALAGIAPLDDALLIACLCAVAGLLSARTNRMLARQETLHRTRDDLALRTQFLLDEKHELEARLKTSIKRSEGSTVVGATRSPGERISSSGASDLQPPVFKRLTERELEVARLIAEGLDNREIAQAAYMSEGTVRNHISSILSKLHLKNRTQIAIAYWRG